MDRKEGPPVSPASDRILDRKIESRALPSGFSSNLGRKAPAGDKAGAGKSVKAIVDWLEKTTSPPETPEPRTQDAQDIAKNAEGLFLPPNHTESNLVQAGKPGTTTASVLFRPKTSPTHPEEYSLTLLGYKSYFNNRPLARCLDDGEPAFTPAAKSTPIAAASASSCYSTQKLDSVMATLMEMRNETDPGSPTPLGRSSLKHESRIRESHRDDIAPKVETSTASGTPDPKSALDSQAVCRDSAEVEAF